VEINHDPLGLGEAERRIARKRADLYIDLCRSWHWGLRGRAIGNNYSLTNGAALKALLAEAISRCPRAGLLESGAREGLMLIAVKDYEDVFADPQAAANDTFQTVPSWDGTEIVQVRAPYRFLDDGLPASRPYRRPPMLGEHSGEVLAELGYPAAAIAELAGSGVIGD